MTKEALDELFKITVILGIVFAISYVIGLTLVSVIMSF